MSAEIQMSLKSELKIRISQLKEMYLHGIINEILFTKQSHLPPKISRTKMLMQLIRLQKKMIVLVMAASRKIIVCSQVTTHCRTMTEKDGNPKRYRFGTAWTE